MTHSDSWLDSTFGGPVKPCLPADPFNGIAVVGKAPGSVEAITGIPFAGKSGRLLDKILDLSGIVRAQTLLVNVFEMQPAWTATEEGRRVENDVSLFFTAQPELGNTRLASFQGMHVLTGPDENVRDLWRVLRKYQPRVIIACGGVALWALTGKDRIGDVRGSFLTTDCVTAPVMATYHPAYALHKEDESIAVRIRDDFITARERAETMAAPSGQAESGD